MPTYEYACRACGHTFEIVQSMQDDSLTVCPECGGELRKVFAPPAISFKGSGFYATDHGKEAKTSASDKREGAGSDKREGAGSAEQGAGAAEKKDTKTDTKTSGSPGGSAKGESGSSSSGGKNGSKNKEGSS
jgi:putative FmdB family regulatory protein